MPKSINDYKSVLKTINGFDNAIIKNQVLNVTYNKKYYSQSQFFRYS